MDSALFLDALRAAAIPNDDPDSFTVNILLFLTVAVACELLKLGNRVREHVLRLKLWPNLGR